MTEPDWAKVLLALHEGQLATDINKGGSFSMPIFRRGDLEEELSLSTREIGDALEYLNDVRLITWFRPGVTDEEVPEEIQVALTPQGFYVAHEREMRDRQQNLLEAQNRTTGALAMFTAILGAAASIQAIASIANAGNLEKQIFLGVVFVLLLVVLYIFRNELLEGKS